MDGQRTYDKAFVVGLDVTGRCSSGDYDGEMLQLLDGNGKAVRVSGATALTAIRDEIDAMLSAAAPLSLPQQFPKQEPVAS